MKSKESDTSKILTVTYLLTFNNNKNKEERIFDEILKSQDFHNF